MRTQIDYLADADKTKIDLRRVRNKDKKSKIHLVPQFLMQKICNKTGRFLGYQNNAQIEHTISIIGLERTIVVLSQQFTQYVAPHWIFTDAQALDELKICDPVGYYMYALNACSPNTFTKTVEDIIALNERHQELTLACKDEAKLHNIVKCNILFSLKLAAVSAAELKMDLVKIDQEVFCDPITVYTKVMTSFTEYCQKRRKHKKPVTLAELKAVRYDSTGTGGFRQQAQTSKHNVAVLELISTFIGISQDWQQYDFSRTQINPEVIEKRKERKLVNIGIKLSA